MSDLDYPQFVDHFLVAVADEQEPPGLCEVDVEALCRRTNLAFEETWLHLVAKDLETQGLGSDRSTMKSRRFLINGAGLRQASAIRRASAPKSLTDRLVSEKAQRLVNLGNFLIAIAALVVAAIALLRTGN